MGVKFSVMPPYRVDRIPRKQECQYKFVDVYRWAEAVTYTFVLAGGTSRTLLCVVIDGDLPLLYIDARREYARQVHMTRF